MSIEHIKRTAKRSQAIVRLYSKIHFLKSVPITDLLHFRKVRLISTVTPYTLLPYPRLSKLYEVASYLEKKRMNGSFVECGVWNGGSAGMIASAAKHNKNRHIWLFDSWEGLPVPSEYDISYKEERGEEGSLRGSEETVKELIFEKLRLDNSRVHLVKGWFSDTIPLHRKNTSRIALLHLDCDWYESVRFCLEELYDDVIKNGFVFLDDYGYWKGCKRAVDEFVNKRDLGIELIKIDHTGVYFQK